MIPRDELEAFRRCGVIGMVDELRTRLTEDLARLQEIRRHL